MKRRSKQFWWPPPMQIRRVMAQATIRTAPGFCTMPPRRGTFFGAVVLAVFSAVERASGAMMASSPTTNNASHKRFGLPTSAARDPYRDNSDAVAYDPDPNLDANHHHHATPTRALRRRKIEPGSVQQQKQRSR
ncbi:hypothetical protein EDB89DRAFT_1916958 [Lactarius sanguifluus]|nr:hypothetical protein EDB89DRAFT_1916958 [Lactarius sanguifluus]